MRSQIYAFYYLCESQFIEAEWRIYASRPSLVYNEGIRQFDSSDTGNSDNVNIAAEHQEPAEVLSQLDNTSKSPVYGEYKCC